MNTLDRFASEYQEVHGISAARRKEQQRELHSFERFAGKPVEQCVASDLSAYMGELSASLHPNTVRKRINMIRPFFRWGYQVGLVDAERWMRIRETRNPRSKPSKPRPYKRREIAALWEVVNQYPDATENQWARFRRGTGRYGNVFPELYRKQLTAILRIALECGLRRSEICNLTLADAHPDNAGIAVRNGKGGKDRQVPMTNAVRDAIAEWLAVRRTLKPKHKQLWLNLNHEQPNGTSMRLFYDPVNPNEAQKKQIRRGERALKVINRPANPNTFGWYFRKLGIEPHRLRHTCATEWLRAGMPIHLLQKLLGHSSIKDTQIYTEILNDDVQDAVEKLEGKL